MRDEIKKYYEATKYDFDKQDIIQEFEWPITWTKIFYKTYPRFPKRKLEICVNQGNNTLEDILIKRESTRNFSNKPLSFNTLSDLLFYSVGIKPKYRNTLNSAKRMYPSAGARYPVETYFVANNIQTLDKGLYHYSIKSNEIETLIKKDLSKEMQEIINADLYKAPLIIILTGELSRTEVKYGANAYRFALLEAGHIGQNIYLLAEKYKLGCCAIGGFDNDKITCLLDLTEDEIPLYLFVIGNKNG